MEQKMYGIKDIYSQLQTKVLIYYFAALTSNFIPNLLTNIYSLSNTSKLKQLLPQGFVNYNFKTFKHRFHLIKVFYLVAKLKIQESVCVYYYLSILQITRKETVCEFQCCLKFYFQRIKDKLLRLRRFSVGFKFIGN